MAQRSPRVLHLAWGHTEVEGLGVLKDVKLFPGGGRPWDWAETGTRHSPGIQAADVEELLAHGATVVVLTRGMDEQLQTDPSTLTTLADRGIQVHVAETRDAVAIYNDLAEAGAAVGALIHSTC